ncbi:MAG: zinc ribbon domain-containing protein [Anaerolineales bacterium]|nr:zinc ribbon domain-containing protein [Anaerolineales bacterium]
MTTSAILFSIGLVLLAVYFIARPFREAPGPSGRKIAGSERLELLIHKAAIYAAIQEIDADVAVGKLEVADHRVLRQRYVSEGVSILKTLDELPAGDSIDAAIERDISRYRTGESLSGEFCPTCGTPVESKDRFCAACGERLGG